MNAHDPNFVFSEHADPEQNIAKGKAKELAENNTMWAKLMGKYLEADNLTLGQIRAIDDRYKIHTEMHELLSSKELDYDTETARLESYMKRFEGRECSICPIGQWVLPAYKSTEVYKLIRLRPQDACFQVQKGKDNILPEGSIVPVGQKGRSYERTIKFGKLETVAGFPLWRVSKLERPKR